MSDVELVIVENAKEVAAVVAEHLASATREGGHVVLTGGTTPERAYEEAARLAPDWDKVELWWGDERCVPPDHELSNFGMAKRALLDRLERAPRAVHRIKGELGKDRAAAEYEQELGATQLDLLLLGVGSDGHVASLFPNAPTLQQRKRVLSAEPDLEPPPHLGRVEGGGRQACLCLGTVPEDAREPRPSGPRAHHCNPRSRCCSHAPCLTGPSLYVELPPDQTRRVGAGDAGTRQA